MGKDIDKKILIGSIIIVAILIGVSFTTVLGYNSVETNLKASPLFNIRTSRAIDEESKDLFCNYIGKGEEFAISFPKRDNRAELLQFVMNAIGKMDDRTFNRFKNLVIEQIYKRENIKNDIIGEEIQLLHQGKYAPETLKKYLINLNGDEANPPTMISFADECCISYKDPKCYIFFLLLFISWILISIPYIIVEWILYFYCLFTPAKTFE